MKKGLLTIISCALACSLTVAGLTSCEKQKERFTQTYLDYFDTASTVVGYEYDTETFDQNCALIEQQLKEYHRLYDIYHTYDGISNICTVNKNAGVAPVKVDRRIIDLLDYSLEMYELTDGKVNVAMGSVLKLWHACREAASDNPAEAALPEEQALREAAGHTDITKVIIDRENSTVFLADEDMSLDVGAIAKGYATEQIAKALAERGITSYTLNIGGNIRTIGTKGNGEPWTASITNPDINAEQPYIMRVELTDCVLVTSGSYQRYFEVDGVRYHHIIDPDTLYPENNFTAVSILSDDSGKADALSTAVFNMSYEDGKRLIESLESTEALWVAPDGKIDYTDGFEKIIIE